MRSRLVAWTIAIIAGFLWCSAARAQSSSKSAGANVGGDHDLSGVWLMDEDRYHQDPRLYGGPSKVVPPLTPWGKEQFDAAMPGSKAGTGDSDNDPILHCDPIGFPRIMGPGPFEIVQLPGKIVMLFEDQLARRQIWTDGRSLPKDPDPTWYGYSVGKWQGDTLVVDTVGLNDRSWMDGGGHPHSDLVHVVERFRRPNHDTLELSFTIDDPKAYTKPWVSTEPKVYKLRPKLELLESPCVPEDEESFLKTVREPAAPKSSK